MKLIAEKRKSSKDGYDIYQDGQCIGYMMKSSKTEKLSFFPRNFQVYDLDVLKDLTTLLILYQEKLNEMQSVQ